MRIQLASDLHLEFLTRRFPGERMIKPAHQADVLVLAGDICDGSFAIDLFHDWPVPVIFVAGNHEAYNFRREDVLDEIRSAARDTSVHFLERDVVDFGGVRFLGCTLWTDYRLAGVDLQLEARKNAQRCLNDHRVISNRDGSPFLPKDAYQDHQISRAWLHDELRRPYDGTTVVVTHHGPHPLSVHPRYRGDILNTAFVSDLTVEVEQADFWLHGHVHDSFDYMVGKCRVVANPLGYARNRLSVTNANQLTFENIEFQYACVIDVTE